jgi:hypothetical protein
MSTISASGERTFVRLWTHCDDQGRCIDNPRLIKAALYPLHDDMTATRVDEDLDELARADLLVRYEVDGKRYLAVQSFSEYQKPKYPTESKLPDPVEGSPSPSPVLPQSFPEPLHGDGEGVVVGVGVGERRVSVERRPRDPDPLFAEFWKLYPLKKGKGDAARAYTKARKRASHSEIIAGVARAAPDWIKLEDVRFIPHPATWLNRDGWHDEPSVDLECRRQEIAAAEARERMGLPDPWADDRAELNA